MADNPYPSSAPDWDAVSQAARAALEIEAQAIQAAIDRLDDSLLRAARLVLEHTAASGKVVVTGLGKSGYVARKIAATLTSTGTPAVFLHPTEAAHGDLGVYAPGDLTLLLSKSGATAELLMLAPILRSFQSPLIGILGNRNSPLARLVDVFLDASVEREADPLNLAPTASTTLALALGDALAAALMQARRFSSQDFARLHPNGQLGRNLLNSVSQVMHSHQQVACVLPATPIHQVIIQMSQYNLGAACVVDEGGFLQGIITDGDLRRALRKYEQNLGGLHAADLMTTGPVVIHPEALLHEAVHLMEDRPSQIYVLPVTGPQHELLGLVRLHDIYHPEGL